MNIVQTLFLLIVLQHERRNCIKKMYKGKLCMWLKIGVRVEKGNFSQYFSLSSETYVCCVTWVSAKNGKFCIRNIHINFHFY